MTNIYYLVGFAGHNPKDAYLVFEGSNYYLFSTELYQNHSRQIAKNNNQIKNIKISGMQPAWTELAEICRKNNWQKIFFESQSLSCSDYSELTECLKSVHLLPTVNLVEKMRQIKTDQEIELMKKSGQICDLSLSQLIPHIKPGKTELELSFILKKIMLSLQVEPAFESIIASGSNSSQPHYMPQTNNRRIGKNDLIQIDLGVKYRGYCSDKSRVIIIGKTKSSYIKCHQAVRDAFDFAIRQIKSGELRGHILDRKIKNFIRKQGYRPYAHSLGHGLGLSIHENPRLSWRKPSELKNNMAFTIEPAIYLDGQFGIRLEDTLVLRNHKLQFLTKSDLSPIVI